MNKRTLEPKNNRKSKLEKEMENLSKQLKQKEIKPMEFAEHYPVKVGRFSKKNVVRTAVAAYKEKYGTRAYNEIVNDIDAVTAVVRHFVVGYMTNIGNAYDALENVKGNNKAFELLTQKALDESLRVYPWLDDDFFLY
ncbi:hypothetical protein QMN07_17350 [Leptospira santarosai]|uniref:hypothetical protein n=1 Tax=Leptospira santarosai TaxID=28183 RepID=UPI0024AF93F2|nr:hypothetical protein [Leptospira santarosai]MDI7219253.1 hypothetical protein [Leptospira santarosai]MDI7219260.1 hypothetical protein [Leptospira santarosai]